MVIVVMMMMMMMMTMIKMMVMMMRMVMMKIIMMKMIMMKSQGIAVVISGEKTQKLWNVVEPIFLTDLIKKVGRWYNSLKCLMAFTMYWLRATLATLVKTMMVIIFLY